MRYKLFSRVVLLLIVGVFFTPAFVFAAPSADAPKVSIESLSVDQKNDFVLEPGKVEIFLNPGDTVTRAIYVTDRVEGSTKFKISVEDIKGTNDPDQPVVILDGQRGPYSGKDFISPAVDNTTLSFGQRITIPFTISIPKDASPGEYDSSILVSNQPNLEVSGDGTGANGTTNVISRLGALVFIRVNGPANEKGELDDFRINGPSKLFYNSGPITFQVLFNNSGNVHLVPYGTITIKNMIGQVVEQLPIDAYFSLPDSLRYREITWPRQTLLGRYTATVTLNRGYGGIEDSKTIAFWVIPWRMIIGIFIGVFLLLLLVVIFARTFELKRKNRYVV